MTKEEKEVKMVLPREWAPGQRPPVLTIFCIIGFFSVAGSALAHLAPDYAPKIAELHPNFKAMKLSFLSLFAFAYLGLWCMKKWGYILLGLCFAGHMALLFSTGAFTPPSLLPIFVLLSSMGYFREMK